MDTRRHLFDGLHNFRDFGGYAAGDRSIVAGRFFRSANHARGTDAGLARLREMGIGAVIDLRRPSERQRQPSRRWADFSGVVIENDDHDEGAETWDTFMTQWDMTEESFRAYMMRYYTRAPHLPRLVELFARYFDVVANGDGAVVVHCAAGKDRTGLVTALALAAAGVPYETIIEDYALTSVYLGEEYRAEARQRAEQNGLDWEQYQRLLGCPPEYMQRTLAYLDGRHGGTWAGLPVEILRDDISYDVVSFFF